MFKFLGMTDEVTACDCCGKKDLKRTCAFDRDGEVVHYGTTCAGRNTGTETKVWVAGAAKEREQKIGQASLILSRSAELAAFNARMYLRARSNVAIGKASADFVRDANTALYARKVSIAAEFGLEPYEVR